MRTYDLSPLFRSSVGFDRLNSLFDMASRGEDAVNYPPYNIEKHGEDQYRITMAVAGFGEEDLDITWQTNQLTVSGKLQDAEQAGESRQASEEDKAVQYLHRGIASRAFQHKFGLADHIRVSDARLENGLLHIDLVREVPEALKPRKVDITASKAKILEAA